MMAVPAMAQAQVLMDTLGDEVNRGFVLLAGLASLGYRLVSVRVTASLPRRERIIFGHWPGFQPEA